MLRSHQVGLHPQYPSDARRRQDPETKVQQIKWAKRQKQPTAATSTPKAQHSIVRTPNLTSGLDEVESGVGYILHIYIFLEILKRTVPPPSRLKVALYCSRQAFWSLVLRPSAPPSFSGSDGGCKDCRMY